MPKPYTAAMKSRSIGILLNKIQTALMRSYLLHRASVKPRYMLEALEYVKRVAIPLAVAKDEWRRTKDMYFSRLEKIQQTLGYKKAKSHKGA